MNNYITYRKLELLICIHFPKAVTGVNKEGVSLCGSFKCNFGALMWSWYLLLTLKKKAFNEIR